MLSSYRSLLGRPGTRELLLVCALAWLAFSGYGLALILAVHQATRSYAAAGAAVAVESIGAGALAPLRGRLVDEHGAHALRGLGLGHVISGALLTTCLVGHLTVGVFVGAALVGGTAPPLIGVARTRWVAVAGENLARTAHALNAALSDGAQIATPAAVAGIALATSPLVTIPLLIAAAATAALILSTNIPPRRSEEQSRKLPRSQSVADGLLGILRRSPGLRALAACDLATAGWLAGLEIAVIAIAGRHGPPELGALILAASALGSITVTLLTGAGKIPGTPITRYRAGAVLAGIALPFTLLSSQLAVLAAILLGVGGAFGLSNVAVYELEGRSLSTRAHHRGIHLADRRLRDWRRHRRRRLRADRRRGHTGPLAHDPWLRRCRCGHRHELRIQTSAGAGGEPAPALLISSVFGFIRRALLATETRIGDGDCRRAG